MKIRVYRDVLEANKYVETFDEFDADYCQVRGSNGEGKPVLEVWRKTAEGRAAVAVYAGGSWKRAVPLEPPHADE